MPTNAWRFHFRTITTISKNKNAAADNCGQKLYLGLSEPKAVRRKNRTRKSMLQKKDTVKQSVSVHSVSFPPYGIGQFSTISWIISGWFEILIQGGQKFNSVGKLNSIGKWSIQSSSVGTSGKCCLHLLLFFWWLAPRCCSVCPGGCSCLWTTSSQLLFAI